MSKSELPPFPSLHIPVPTNIPLADDDEDEAEEKKVSFVIPYIIANLFDKLAAALTVSSWRYC